MRTSEFLDMMRWDPDFDAFGAAQPEEWEIGLARNRNPYKHLADIWDDANAVRKCHDSGSQEKLQRALTRFHESCNVLYAACDDELHLKEECKISEWMLHEAATRNELNETMDSAMGWFDQWVYGFNHKAIEEEYRRKKNIS